PLAVPPPLRLLVRRVPTRALPVPFWRNSLRVLPATSPRRSVECVPARWLARCISTTSCKSCLLTLPPKSAGSTSTVPTFSPWRLYTLSGIMVSCFPGKNVSTPAVSEREASATTSRAVGLVATKGQNQRVHGGLTDRLPELRRRRRWAAP